MGIGAWGRDVKCGRKLVTVQSCCRKVGPSIFVTSFLVKIVVQLVKRLLPLTAAHHSLVIASGDLVSIRGKDITDRLQIS